MISHSVFLQLRRPCSMLVIVKNSLALLQLRICSCLQEFSRAIGPDYDAFDVFSFTPVTSSVRLFT